MKWKISIKYRLQSGHGRGKSTNINNRKKLQSIFKEKMKLDEPWDNIFNGEVDAATASECLAEFFNFVTKRENLCSPRSFTLDVTELKAAKQPAPNAT